MPDGVATFLVGWGQYWRQLYAGRSDPQTTLRYAQAIDVDEAIAAVNNMVRPNL